jgi:perosamine synthetase
VSSRILHSKPTLPCAEEWAEITRQLAPGWVADGPCVEAFSQAAATWLGGAGGVAVNSGTCALHLALLAVGVTPGSDVLVPAYCCAALLNAVRLADAEPVLVDAEPGGFNISAEDARRRITPRAAAVVVAHLFGDPVRLGPFLQLGIPVIEDCAQSFGATDGPARTGGRGAAAIGSFYATKVITTGHGGLVSTQDMARLAALRDLVEYDNRDEWRLRFSYRMSELQAALGLWQLARLPAFLARRRALAAYYDGRGGEAGCGDGRRALTAGEELCGGPIFYRYVVRVPDADSFIGALQSRGIDAKRPVYRPLHHYLGGDFPHAQAAHEQIVSLPLYPALTDSEAEHVAEMARVHRRGAPVRRRSA